MSEVSPVSSEISIDIRTILTTEEQNQLAGILKCDVDDLNAALEPYAKASLQEYLRMFLGQKVFTRGSDFKEYRLFLLVKEAFDNKIPHEQRICDLFQTTSSESKSLVRSVMSKYQYELHEAIQGTLVQTITEAVKEDGDGWIITVHSENIVDSLNRQISSLDGSLPPISKKRDSVCCYIVKPSAYEKLCEYFGLEVPETDG